MKFTTAAAQLGVFKPGAILAVLTAIAIIVLAARHVYLGPEVAIREATRTDLVQSIVASGRIVTPRRVLIGTTGTDRVVAVPVAEGQRVARGQVLIELDSRDESVALAQARAALDQSEARLRQIRDLSLPAAEQTLQQTLANATQAKVQHERTLALRAKGFIGEAQADDTRRNLDVTESQVRAARLQIESLRSGGSDHALAVSTAEQSRATVRANEVRLEQTRIRAPVDGVLIARSVEPGNVVAPGKDLMVLAPDGETQIVVQLDERHLSRLALGQTALASADAFADKRFNAQLIYINPGVDALRGTVEVKLRVLDPPVYLRQDMTVSVDIETARRKAAIAVAMDAIRDPGSDSPWVLAIREHRAVRLPVKLGIRGDSRVEVLEGIASGEVLIAASHGAISAGDRVRAAVAAAPK
ncbi:MAG: efflux RND transporter periplasmic adaptor subunit [Burkholderiales bacterium]